MSDLTFDHYRPEWVDPAQPVTGPAFHWSNIREIVAHYPGCDCDNIPDGDLDEPWETFPGYMRAMQSAYLRRDPPYSIGYNGIDDARGHAWEARGDTFRNAANVGRKFSYNRNSDTISWKFAVDRADPASPAAVARCRRFVAEARAAAGRHLPIRPHSYYDWTACPGIGIRAQIEAGVFEPVATSLEVHLMDAAGGYLVAKTPNGAYWIGTPVWHRWCETATMAERYIDALPCRDLATGALITYRGDITEVDAHVIAKYMGQRVA